MRVIIGFDIFDETDPEVPLKGKELEQAVEEDLSRFENFFRSLGNDGLNKFEKAILKTYLHWKAHNSPQPVEKDDG